MSNPHLDPERRHDFVFLCDVTDGNPNGDPDTGNLPRVDPETMEGMMTDTCLKRKVRDFVAARKDASSESRYKIYVEEDAVLNKRHERAYEEHDAIEADEQLDDPDRETIGKAKAWMCRNFYDIRTFGAVMTTGVNCGQVRGPLQLTFARSIDPISPVDVTLTRVAVTTEEGAEEKRRDMGRKSIVPYGLYRSHGFYNPTFARDTGVDTDDLALFWEALQRMLELDRAADRGMMSTRGLYVFSHEHPLGDAPAHELFDRVEVASNEDVDTPRSFDDYRVRIDDVELPDGVELTRLVG